MKSPGVNNYERQRVATEYYDAVTQTESLRQRIIVHSKNLKTIARGHQKLYDNLDRISAADLKESLLRYAVEIGDLIDEFHHLKDQ